MRGRIPNVDCGIWWSYLGPKQRLSLIQNVYREDENDEERAGRPSTSTTNNNIDGVKRIVLVNRRITVREVAEDLKISIGSCHSIFTNDLDMTRVTAKFVTKLLNFDQKQHRINTAQAIFPQRVITGDESWVYGYDVETKAQSSDWADKDSVEGGAEKITKNDFLKCFENWKNNLGTSVWYLVQIALKGTK